MPGSTLTPCDITTNLCPPGTMCVAQNPSMSAAGLCVPGCNLVTQDCGPAQQCLVAAVDGGGVGRVCAPRSPTNLAPGSTCTPALPDPCQVGSQCVQVQGASTCREFCSITSVCSRGACTNIINFAGASGATESHLICEGTGCDPLSQQPCTLSQNCSLTASGSSCLPAGTVPNGGTCSGAATCARGLQCVVSAPGASTGLCRRFCNLDGGLPSCTSGTCQALMAAGGVGVCSM
jgi:hypothetical protein